MIYEIAFWDSTKNKARIGTDYSISFWCDGKVLEPGKCCDSYEHCLMPLNYTI